MSQLKLSLLPFDAAGRRAEARRRSKIQEGTFKTRGTGQSLILLLRSSFLNRRKRPQPRRRRRAEPADGLKDARTAPVPPLSPITTI